MQLKLVNRGESAEVLMIGRLDVIAAQEVEKNLLDVAGRFSEVTLNLESLDYISSAGLRSLRSFYIAMSQKGGKMTVTNVPKQIMDIFEVTGFAFFL